MKLLREVEGENLSLNSPVQCNSLNYADQQHFINEASAFVTLLMFLVGLGWVNPPRASLKS